MMTNEEEFNPIEQESQPASAAEDAAGINPAAPTPAPEDGDSADSSSQVAEEPAAQEPPITADESAQESQPAMESGAADAAEEP
ncbi:hypothetical protein Q6251_29640, partial [Klebsiella quasipneumoniae]|nr:hypothetical protein [Klebsiella quasipneumoniae]